MSSLMEGMEARLHDLQIGFEGTTAMLRDGTGPSKEVLIHILDELNRQFRAVTVEFEEVSSKRAVLQLIK